MSSSLLHILAGAFGIIESPLDPKLLCHLDVVFECVCVFVCVLARMARDEALNKDKRSRAIARKP